MDTYPKILYIKRISHNLKLLRDLINNILLDLKIVNVCITDDYNLNMDDYITYSHNVDYESNYLIRILYALEKVDNQNEINESDSINSPSSSVKVIDYETIELEKKKLLTLPEIKRICTNLSNILKPSIIKQITILTHKLEVLRCLIYDIVVDLINSKLFNTYDYESPTTDYFTEVYILYDNSLQLINILKEFIK